LVTSKPTVLARFLDLVWWLAYVLAAVNTYLTRGLISNKSARLRVPFVGGWLRQLVHGWLAGYLIGRGWSVDRARKTTIGSSIYRCRLAMIAAYTSDAGITRHDQRCFCLVFRFDQQ